MLRFAMVLMGGCLLSAGVWWETNRVVGQEPAAAELEARSFSPAAEPKQVLLYRFLAPAQLEANQRYPLLLCLHGAGERGNNNTAQVGHFQPLFSAKAREQFPCYVVIPQVPQGQLWATYGWSTKSATMSAEPSPTLKLAKALVDEIIQKHPVDPQRIYVTGLSMGGYGTWEFSQRWPDLVAAAVPVCGGGDLTCAASLRDVPIWAFHGDRDTVIRPESSAKIIEAIQAGGGKPKFTLYPGVGHNAWSPAYRESDLLPWLFAQRKK